MTSNIVMIGQVRDLLDLHRIFAGALAFRASGLVDEIWLSTWAGEIDRHPGLGARLAAAGIGVVESPPLPPPPAFAPHAMWNSFLQMTALRRGIAAMGTDRPVLKLRTDKVVPLLPFFERSLRAGPAPIQAHAGLPPVLAGKVSCRLLRAAVPLHVSDLVFYGHARDLLLLADRDGGLQADSPSGSLGVENRWLLAPFARTFPRLRSYYTHVQAFEMMEALGRWGETGAGPMPPAALFDILALNFALMDGYLDPVDERDAPDVVQVEALFDPMTQGAAWSKPSARGVLRNIANGKVLAALASGDVAPSPAGEAYGAARARLGETAMKPFSEDEVDALGRFATAHGAPRAVRGYCETRAVHVPPALGPEAFSDAAGLDPFHEADGADAVTRSVVADRVGSMGGQNSAIVYRAIGELFAKGRGVPLSPERALVWYERAARLRDAAAQTAYAQLVYETLTNTDDHTRQRAQAWLRDAARRHQPAAALWQRHFG